MVGACPGLTKEDLNESVIGYARTGREMKRFSISEQESPWPGQPGAWGWVGCKNILSAGFSLWHKGKDQCDDPRKDEGQKQHENNALSSALSQARIEKGNSMKTNIIRMAKTPPLSIPNIVSPPYG